MLQKHGLSSVSQNNRNGARTDPPRSSLASILTPWHPSSPITHAVIKEDNRVHGERVPIPFTQWLEEEHCVSCHGEGEGRKKKGENCTGAEPQKLPGQHKPHESSHRLADELYHAVLTPGPATCRGGVQGSLLLQEDHHQSTLCQGPSISCSTHHPISSVLARRALPSMGQLGL